MSDSPKPGFQWYWGGREGSRSASVSSGRDEEPGRVSTAATASGSTSSSALREENEVAELVLEQLDEQWFCDNVVRWPSSRPASPPGVIDKNLGSPFQRREFGTAGSSTQAEVVAGAVKSRAWSGERGFHHPRSRLEIRRLSDGDHYLRKVSERDQIPRRRLLEGEENRRFADSSNVQSASLPQTPTKFETNDQSRAGNASVNELSPFALASSGRLMGVTEDEEMENDLFAKMLANRPAKLTTINPGRQPRGPLQESNSTEPTKQAHKQILQRRRLKGTKSLTDLEYEELRGLKDLGFEVSKDDLTPHVVRMFPGLQRQGIPPYNSPQSQTQSRYPPVQHLLWPRRPDSPLMNTTFLDTSMDMKGQLKSWASEMASIVSTEC